MPRKNPARPPASVLKPLRDRLGPNLRVLFVGINPGVRSAIIGNHFAGYSNRFWKLLHASGLVPVRLTCEEDVRLPDWGYGLTNLISRPSAGIDDLRREEYARGRRGLVAKVRRQRPEIVALVGVTLYRALFPLAASRLKARELPLGLKREKLAAARVFVLPNPSGRNANYRFEEMLEAFRALKRHLEG